MKYISFVIPCFNSSAYMNKCIDYLLESCNHDDIEILIIDDGSTKDNTYDIAKSYEERYKGTCRAIHKENGGHGSVLNLGIKEATGKYLKVIDSDDWLGQEETKTLVENIKNFNNEEPDLIITNFIYDKVGKVNKTVMKYHFLVGHDKISSWDDISTPPIGKYLLMHALTYKTSVLRECKLDLPEHTFYVDNIFAYKPLPYVKTFIYYDIDLYHYFIGRNDQSVNEPVMISRLDQQYRVTRAMLYEVDLDNVKSDKLKKYMLNYMSIVMSISSVLSIRAKDKKWLVEKKNLWEELKNKNRWLYDKLYYTFLGIGCNLPTPIGRFITVTIYKISQAVVGFN